MSHRQALSKAATGNARLLTIAGAGHGTMPTGRKGIVRREAVAWFDEWLGEADQTASRSDRR